MNQRDFDELVISLHDWRGQLDVRHQAALRAGNQPIAAEIHACMVHIDRTVAHVVLAQSKRNLGRAA